MQHWSTHHYVIRQPEVEHVNQILCVFEEEVQAGLMLPRQPGEIIAHLDDWLIIMSANEVFGCVSLVYFNNELCEIRSLAVAAAQRGQGLGTRLIREALAMARQKHMKRVLVLTRSTIVFERAGFQQSNVNNFPQKVWRDCRPCPLRHRCDEVALLYYLDAPSKNGNKYGLKPCF